MGDFPHITYGTQMNCSTNHIFDDYVRLGKLRLKEPCGIVLCYQIYDRYLSCKKWINSNAYFEMITS